MAANYAEVCPLSTMLKEEALIDHVLAVACMHGADLLTSGFACLGIGMLVDRSFCAHIPHVYAHNI